MYDDGRRALAAEVERRKLSAILRWNDRNTAERAMRAAVDGGFRMVEFTLTTPGALDLIREFRRDDRLLVGAGTVLDRSDAVRAVEAGAQFLVSPAFDRSMVEAAQELGVPSIPGTYTPTEMLEAWRAGADFVKLFPSPADIPLYIRQVRGPLPMLRIVPTSGVDETNFLDILEAGAAGVGFVTNLFRPEDLERGEHAPIAERARRIHQRFGG